MLVTYPINAARNMAMLLARTELVFPMDIDFLISRDFSDIVLDPARRGLAPHTTRREDLELVIDAHGEGCARI